MSTYYQLDVDSLEEALEYCDAYQQLRPSAVFRGQANVEWALTANAFRPSRPPFPFSKTEQLELWWTDQADTPRLSSEELWQVAQEYAEYGLCTDLLDFSHSPRVAAFFALGAPRDASVVLPARAALFLIDPTDFERIHGLLNMELSAAVPPRLAEVLKRYTQIWWPNKIGDLHRQAAQQGCFVRDPNGTLEGVTDGTWSLLPLIYEDAFGHPPLLKKVSFFPKPQDVISLSRAGVTKSALFPLPNQLEGYITRFLEESKWKVYL